MGGGVRTPHDHGHHQGAVTTSGGHFENVSYKESKTSDHESLFSRSCDDGKVVTLKIEYMKQHPLLLSDKKIEFDISVSVVSYRGNGANYKVFRGIFNVL